MSKELILYSNHDFQNSGEENRLKEYKVTILISHAKYPAYNNCKKNAFLKIAFEKPIKLPESSGQLL